MASQATIMVVEDDEASRVSRRQPAGGLLRGGVGGIGAQALGLLESARCDLMLLDVVLPDTSGFELCRRVRATDGLAQRVDPDIPMIMRQRPRLGADRACAASTRGATTTSRKPFHYPELAAGSRAVCAAAARARHAARLAGRGAEDRPASRARCRLGGQRVELSAKEFALLRTMAAEPTRVFTKEELLRDVWGLRARWAPPARSTPTPAACGASSDRAGRPVDRERVGRRLPAHGRGA